MFNKKLPLIALAAALTFTLSACNDDSPEPTPNPPATATRPPSPEPTFFDSNEPGVTAPTAAPPKATVQPTPSVINLETEAPETASEAQVDVANTIVAYLQTVDSYSLDEGAFIDELDEITDGADLGNPEDSTPEEVFANFPKDKLEALKEISLKYNPVTAYFDYSKSSVEEEVMVNLLVLSLIPMGDFGDENGEISPYVINYSAIQVSDDNTAIVSSGTVSGGGNSVLGAIDMNMVNTETGWKIDASAWYATALELAQR